jgi:hypothetical protein
MRFWLSLMASAVLPFVATASPVVLGHQGRLFDAADRPVDGVRAFTFALYEDETGTTSVWESTYDAVTLVAGAYGVQLGDGGTPLDSAALARARWLSVSVEGSELLPRLRIGSVPFAVFAHDAASLGGTGAGEYLTKTLAASTYLTTSSAQTLFATKEEQNACLLKSDAAATYLTKADAGAFLTASVLNDYALKTDLSAYAKSADLAAYAKSADLAPYAKSADLAPYAKSADLAPYAKTTDVATTYLAKADYVADPRNVLENGGLEAWWGVSQNVGFNATSATTYIPQLPIGWSGLVNGSTSTPEGVDPASAMSSWLTTGRVVSRQTVDPKEGAAYARLSFPSQSRDAGVELKLSNLAVEPNRTYSLAFWARVQAGTNPLNDLYVTAADKTWTLTPLPTTWTRLGPFTFTTGSDVSAVNLVLKPRGLGGTVDIDGVGLWRGAGIGDTADPRLGCRGGMVNAGDFCIEPVSAGLAFRNINWHDANSGCRSRGRRLCAVDELAIAMRSGVIASSDANANGNFAAWANYTAHGGGGYQGWVSSPGAHVNMSYNNGTTPGELSYGAYQYGTWAHIGRLCCTSR